MNVGVTTISDDSTALPTLSPINEPIFPDPDDAESPIVVLSFVQLKLVPTTPNELVNWTVSDVVPEQIIWSIDESTDGVGFTISVNTTESPTQLTPPFSKEGITVIVATIGVFVVFVAVKDKISPFPALDKPIVVSSFSHVKVVPAVKLEKKTSAVWELLQTT